MVRTLWITASLLTATLAPAAQPVRPTTASAVPERLITIQELNRPAQVCRIVQSWRTAAGIQVHDMQSVATGDRLTVVENGPMEMKAQPGTRAVSTQIFHWTADGKRPAGCPSPPAGSVLPVVVSRPMPSAHAAPVATSVKSQMSKTPATTVATSKSSYTAQVARPMPTAVGTRPSETGIQRVSAEIIAAPIAKPTPAAVAQPEVVCEPPMCVQDCQQGRRPSVLGSLWRPKKKCETVECEVPCETEVKIVETMPKAEKIAAPMPMAEKIAAPMPMAEKVAAPMPTAVKTVEKIAPPISVYPPSADVCEDCSPAPKHKIFSKLRKPKVHTSVCVEPYPHGMPEAVKVVGEDTRVTMPTKPPVDASTAWDKPKLGDRFHRKKCDEACVTEFKPGTVAAPYMPPADDKPKVSIEAAQPSNPRESWGKIESLPAVPVKPEQPAVAAVKSDEAKKPAVAAVKSDEARKPAPNLPDPEALKKAKDPLLNPDRYLSPPVAEELGVKPPAATPGTEAKPNVAGEQPAHDDGHRPGRRPNFIDTMKNRPAVAQKKPVSTDSTPTVTPQTTVSEGDVAMGNQYHGVVPNMNFPGAALPCGVPPEAPNPNRNVFRGQPCCNPPRGAANAFTQPGVQQPVPAETIVGNQSVNAFSGPDGPFVPGGALAGPPPCCPSPLGPCPSPGPGLGTDYGPRFNPACSFPMPGQPMMPAQPMMPGQWMPGMVPGGQTPMLPAPTPGGPAPTLPPPIPGAPMTTPPSAQSAAPQNETAAQLVQMLKASDFPSQREWAADQLASMGGHDAVVTAALLASARTDPAPLVRTGSIRALINLSARDATVIAGLKEVQKDTDAAVRQAAADALHAFGAGQSDIQPVSGQMPEQR